MIFVVFSATLATGQDERYPPGVPNPNVMPDQGENVKEKSRHWKTLSYFFHVLSCLSGFDGKI